MPGGFPLGLEICNGNAAGAAANDVLGTNCSTAWTQLIASCASDVCWMTVSINNNVSSGNFCTANVGVGGAGSEVVVLSKLRADGIGLGATTYAFPISIPAGSRISAQCVDGTNADVSIRTYDGAFTMMEGAAGVDAVGYSAGLGTAVTPSASTGVVGSYAQLVASTSRDYIGFVIAIDTQNNTTSTSAFYWVDVAIGGAGSEQVIVPGHDWYNGSASFNMSHSTSHPIFIPIPVGTRIAARCSANGASKTALGLTLYGMYQ